jgi:hypothetical protein
MNPKMFLLVLLLPVALFATDRLTSTDTPDGGGKEKKKTTTEATRTDPVEPARQIAVADDDIPATTEEMPVQTQASKTDVSKKDNVATISDALDALDQILSEQRDEDQIVYLYDESVSEELSKWLETSVMRPLKQINPLKLDPERSFSRCTSGYRVLLSAKEGKLGNGGWIIGDEGCHPRALGQFEYNVIAQTVQVHLGIDGPLIALDQYLTYLKAALA